MAKIMILILFTVTSFCNISFAEYHPDEQWYPIYDNPKAAYYLNVQYLNCKKTAEHELVTFWTMAYSKESGLIMRSYATEDLCCRLEIPLKFVMIKPDGKTDVMDAPSIRQYPLEDEAGSPRLKVSYILKKLFDYKVYGKPLTDE